MSYCEKCKVNIKSDLNYCPLCENYISNNEKNSLYPNIEIIKEKSYFKYFVFFSILSSVLCLTLDFFFKTGTHWSYFVIFGNITFLILLNIIIKYNKNLNKSIFWIVFLILFISLLWDYFTLWHGWSIAFVIPIIIAFSEINYFLMFLIKNVNSTDNLLYSIIFSSIGTIGCWIIFSLKPYTLIPTLICLLASSIFLIYLIFFKGKHIKNELKKRLHI